MNKVILMGRLTADPEYRQTPQGTSVCRFTIAVDRGYVSKTTGQKEADFIRVETWRSSADFVSRYFNKGKPIVVEGSLRNNDYTDQNGMKRYGMLVVADSVSFTLNDSARNAGNPNNGGGYQNGYGNNYGNNNYGGSYQQGNYGNNGGNGGYQNGYGNNYGNQGDQGGYGNDYYQQPQQPQQQPAPPVYQQQPVNNAPSVPNDVNANPNGDANNGGVPSDVQVGNLEDFEEILSDGEVPF